MSKLNIRALRREREKTRALLAKMPLFISNIDIDGDAPRHPSSRTPLKRRILFQESEKSGRMLARQYRNNPKTVYKWRKRTTYLDEPMGPKRPHAYLLDMTEEDFVTHYRLITGFGLNECLLRLRTVFPKMTRSSLYRCFRRRKVNHLSWKQKTTIEKASANYPPGNFCLTVERDGDGVGFFGAVEHGSGRVYCSRLRHSPEGAVDFLKQLLEHFPDGVKTVSIPHDETIFSCSPAGVGSNPFLVSCRQFNLPISLHYASRAGELEV